MPSSPSLLSDLETCSRKGYFSQFWERWKLDPKDILLQAIRIALLAPNAPETVFGEVAGSAVLQLATDRGLATDQQDVYGSVIHLANLADILVSAIRKPQDEPWGIPSNVQGWTSHCYLSPKGDTLRRISLVSHWNDARHYSECRSWYTLGEQAHYKLPMQIAVLVIGQERAGKRHSAWTQGFLHPANHTLRFRKKSRSTSEVFNDKWEKIWREDHDEISREIWLQGMLKDDVLPEVCFRVDVPVPPAEQCKRIKEIAARGLERLAKMTNIPDPQLSSCDWPVPCVHRSGCHMIPERLPSEAHGFIPVGFLP